VTRTMGTQQKRSSHLGDHTAIPCIRSRHFGLQVEVGDLCILSMWKFQVGADSEKLYYTSIVTVMSGLRNSKVHSKYAGVSVV